MLDHALPLEIAGLSGGSKRVTKTNRYLTELDTVSSFKRNSYAVPDNKIMTYLAVVLERIFFVKFNPAANQQLIAAGGQSFMRVPPPIPYMFKKKLKLQKRLLVGFIRDFGPVTTLTRQGFAERYTGQKRNAYLHAAETLKDTPLQKFDSRIRGFVKHEQIVISPEDYLKQIKVPRGIHPRSLRYNVEFGCKFCPLEKRIYTGIRRMFKDPLPVVLKGFDSKKTSHIIAEKFHRYPDCIAVGLDASRFDQHVSVDALRFEHSIYNSVLQDHDFARIAEWQLSNKIKTFCSDGIAKLKVQGMRMSGDMNTSTGNIIIMTVLLHQFLREKKLLRESSVINNGDDSVIFMSRKNLHLLDGLHEWFLQYGFQMTVEQPQHVLERLEFCQQHILFDGVDWFQVPKLDTINKLMTSCKGIRQHELPYFKQAKAECLLATSGGCPIFDTVARHMISTSEISSSKHERYKRNNLYHSNEYERVWYQREQGSVARMSRPITDEARVSFYLAFGITPAEQQANEDKVRSSPKITFLKDDASGIIDGKLLYL